MIYNSQLSKINSFLFQRDLVKHPPCSSATSFEDIVQALGTLRIETAFREGGVYFIIDYLGETYRYLYEAPGNDNTATIKLLSIEQQADHHWETIIFI